MNYEKLEPLSKEQRDALLTRRKQMTPEQIDKLKNFFLHPVTVIVLGVILFGLTIDVIHSWTLGILGVALVITGVVMAIKKYEIYKWMNWLPWIANSIIIAFICIDVYMFVTTWEWIYVFFGLWLFIALYLVIILAIEPD